MNRAEAKERLLEIVSMAKKLTHIDIGDMVELKIDEVLDSAFPYDSAEEATCYRGEMPVWIELKRNGETGRYKLDRGDGGNVDNGIIIPEYRK